MAAKALPPQDVLRQLLDYDPETGKLFWRAREPALFRDGRQPQAHNAAIWNGKNAGREAFVTALPSGHRYAGIFREKFLAHRVIWKMVHGVEPVGIDHIDGDPSNNRLSNLREAPQSVNGRNLKLKKNNTSGVMGVRWDTRLSRWVSRIHVDYVGKHLGCFDSFDEAVAARRKAEREFGFHENHGRR